jgi:dipeptidyl-peptidase 4
LLFSLTFSAKIEQRLEVQKFNCVKIVLSFYVNYVTFQQFEKRNDLVPVGSCSIFKVSRYICFNKKLNSFGMNKFSTLLVLIALQFQMVCNCQELSVESIWKSGIYSSNEVDGFSSLPDGEHFTKIVQEGEKNLLKKFKFTDFNGSGELMVDLSAILFNSKPLNFDDAQLSNSGKYLILSTQYSGIYRYSYSTLYYLYDIENKSTYQVRMDEKKQTLGTFSPDEKKFAYVCKNDLWCFDLATKKTKQLTKDGKKNEIINGTTDWVYEEEFAITQGFSWSPDSKLIAFMRSDERKVKEFKMALYGDLYPSYYEYKYPKAGEGNSKVTFHLVDVSKGKIKNVALGQYEYLPRFQWSPISNELIVLTMNRNQSEVKYHKVTNMKAPISQVFFTETSATYIDVDELRVLSDGKSLIRTSEKSGYNHIYQLFFNGIQRQITTGEWDVIELNGLSEKSQCIYFASAEHGAINKVLYSINLDGSNKKVISPIEGVHNPLFSIECRYFIRSSSTASTVPTHTLCDQNGKELLTLEDNQELQIKIDKLNISKKEFIQIPGADGTMLNAWVLKPRGFDPDKKYPVYFQVYCGPGHNTVLNQWEGSNQLYLNLLNEKGYIVVSVDPRGTMYRGEKFKKSTYLELGKYETEDVIAAAQFYGHNQYVDPSRIGIQGWSYGGFMTALCLFKGADVFKMGISVAPVTNWKYYDNIYTERFMRTPEENKSGYENNSPINHVDKLEGKLFLIHGSADDNVHYQNTMELVNALVKANKQFDLFIYPNKNHGIYGGNTRNHLFNQMLNYTLENL